MTNETTAPERIWFNGGLIESHMHTSSRKFAGGVEYVRADALEAAQTRIAELEGALGPLVKEAKACGRNINAQWVPLFDEARAALEGKG